MNITPFLHIQTSDKLMTVNIEKLVDVIETSQIPTKLKNAKVLMEEKNVKSTF